MDFRDVPDELWTRIEPLLVPFKRKRSGGSKPLSQRTILAGILYKCRSGCQWAMIPACYGSKSTVHEHFQRWNKAGVMTEIFRILLTEGDKDGIDAQWLIMDSTVPSRRILKKSTTEATDATRQTEGSISAADGKKSINI